MKATHDYYAFKNNMFIIAALIAAMSSFPASGFGQNKVMYDNFKWEYFRLPHFDLYFHQDQGALSKISGQWIENAYHALSNDFNYQCKERIPLIIYGSTNSFARTNVIPDLLPEGVGGFTTRMKNRIVIPFDGSYEELRHVLHHELVHGFQNSMIFDRFGGSLLAQTENSMPLWFAEGMAEYLSSGWNSEADMFLMDATVFGKVALPGPEMNDYMAYKGGQSFLYYVASTRGEALFSKFLRLFGEIKNVDRAFKDVYGKTAQELGEEWLYQLKQIYWPEIGKREEPMITGRPLTSHLKDRDFFNLRPRISPDGLKIAYFSDLRDFTRILIANRKGTIIEEISQTGWAGNFESFHPFRTGLCWSPKSDRIAFVTLYQGKDELRIIDIKKKKLHRTVRTQLSGIYSPDWSSDGKSLVFCGVAADRCDLYLYSLESGDVKRLTDDIFQESDPRFSRDGKRIVFCRQDSSGIADRASNMHQRPASDLFSLDLGSNAIVRLTHGPANEKSPAFSPDGSSILYVSDRNGIDNLYIAPFSSPDSGQALTDVIGGCSSPDWSKDSGSVVYCLFQKAGWDIWHIEEPMKKLKKQRLSATRWAESLTDTAVHFFIAKPYLDEDRKNDSLAAKKKRGARRGSPFSPTDRFSPQPISSIIEEDTTEEGKAVRTDSLKQDAPAAKGKPAAAGAPAGTKEIASGKKKTALPSTPAILDFDTIAPRQYGVKFSPDIIMVGAGVNPYYGSGYAGQAVVVLSDLLGNHEITIAGDVDGNFSDYTHLYASYLNLRYKVNFGAALFYNREYAIRSVFMDSLFFDADVGGILFLSRPFSQFSRLELNVFCQNLYRTPYVFTYNNSLEKDTGRGSETYNLLTPTLSYVYDNILWGITGPLNGVRSQSTVRFSPPIEHINDAFLSIDVDFRRYFHLWKRFVWANKVAFGASIPLGKDKSSARKFFLGGDENWLTYNINIEGYKANVNNFFYSDIVVPFRGWNFLDLVGSKFFVFNTEFRFPFIKEFSVVWPLPIALRYINGAVFMDAGNAWNKEDEYKSVPLPKNIYGGVGFGVRANLGIFVLRFDRAWKTDWQSSPHAPINYWSLGAEF